MGDGGSVVAAVERAPVRASVFARRAVGSHGTAAGVSVDAGVQFGRLVGEPDRVEVEEVPEAAREQEDHFMGVGEPVGDRGGHRVGLGPHHRIAQDPAGGLQRDGGPPRDAEQVLAG